MKNRKSLWVRFIIVSVLMFGVSSVSSANNCSSKLFSVTIDSKLTISDVIENLAETCGLTVLVKDDAANKRMNKKLYYVKLKNSTLRGFLNTILKDNDLHYVFEGNKLTISYLITKTFRVHYVSGERKGNSSVDVKLTSESSKSGNSQGGSSNDSSAGVKIESNDEFKFWKTVEQEVQRILIGAGDGGTHYTKSGSGWVGPDGQQWEYNPLAPIVNPEAGMVTVTGTNRQINRVSRYIQALTKQIKQQVLIDVRIMSVSFDDSSTTGVDWGQLYGLQNLTVNTLATAQKNIASYTWTETGIEEATPAVGAKPNQGFILNLTGNTQVSDVVKFLGTQGNVKSISSPRVMTLNNQPAIISVGTELFYKIKTTGILGTGEGNTENNTETVNSVFAGILLDITPEIDSNGMITLKINPSVSETLDTVTGESGARSIPPDLSKRQIASVIKVKDGEHAILGGLISSKAGTRVSKVPLLGDIPILDYAFKRKEKIDTVEELVLIITPHIVKTSKSVSLKDLGYTKLNEK